MSLCQTQVCKALFLLAVLSSHLVFHAVVQLAERLKNSFILKYPLLKIIKAETASFLAYYEIINNPFRGSVNIFNCFSVYAQSDINQRQSQHLISIGKRTGGTNLALNSLLNRHHNLAKWFFNTVQTSNLNKKPCLQNI